jgi:hypothetical protein
VADAWWSSYRGEACIRVRGLPRESALHVRPARAASRSGLPSMAGRVVVDGSDACFIPGFPFVEGLEYVVEADDRAMARLLRRPRPAPPTAGVIAIRPSAAEVPRNLLRFYVWFSAPMSAGVAAAHVRLLDDDGTPMDGSIMPGEYELWDAERRRLTVLLDPARIKRGLVPHREIGYPLREGRAFTLVVGADFPDARGAALRKGAEHRYQVGHDERRRIDTAAWRIEAPPEGSLAPVRVTFDRSLDHGLLLRCVRISDPAGESVGGTISTGAGERSWSLTPSGPWRRGVHHLIVDPVLEDVAGNSMMRAFDEEQNGGARVPAAPPARLRFAPRTLQLD